MARIVVFLLVVFIAGTAQAQIAVTDLAPPGPVFIHPFATGFNSVNITPQNPAAMAWGAPSYVGVGTLQGEQVNNTAPSTTAFDGKYYGGRFVGETFGFAAEKLRIDMETGEVGDETTGVQISVNLGGVLALGAGMEQSKGDGAQTTIDRQQFGVSLKIGEVFYLGGGVYLDEAEIGGFPGTYERSVTLIGAALRTEGDWKWFIAYDYMDIENFDLGGGNEASGGKGKTVTVQFQPGPLVVGIAITQIEPTGNTGGPDEMESKVIDLGYAPMEGLTVSVRLVRVELDDTATLTIDEEVETNSLTVTWRF